MKRLLIWIVLASCAAMGAVSPEKPRLVVVIVLDQFRYDYLTRFGHEFTGGLKRLLTEGAVFSNAYLEHFPTVTAVGHSVLLTGAMPSISGIVGNEWYDRGSGRSVTSVLDDSVRLLGGTGGTGASPSRLLVSTLGDEMKAASGGKAKVIGLSLKDRAAILTSGHSADAAYWYDANSGHFISSTYYFQSLPAWVAEFNLHATEQYKGAKWLDVKLPEDQGLNMAIVSSPFGNALLEEFAERAISAEGLGRHDVTDLLTVSFSSNDYVGHEFGPDSPQVEEISKRTDEILGKLFRCLEENIGLKKVLVVLSADHGVAPTPASNASRRMPGGYVSVDAVRGPIEAALANKYGKGQWILGTGDSALYLNLELMRQRSLSEPEVMETARGAAMALPHVFRALTRTQLSTGAVVDDMIGRRMLNGFNYARAADLYILLEPYWMFGFHGATHGSPFNYDAHVPVIFMGPGVRSGNYYAKIAAADVAPTLATMLGVEAPSGASGRILTEMLDSPHP